MFGLTSEELTLFRSLNTSGKIQEFIDRIPINFEEDGIDTVLSPRSVLRRQRCHCIEASILAALILRLHGHPPLVVDLTSTNDDFDHVIAVFQQDGKWGAISKTNHYSLRYREPVYESVRELVMSYFHEYFGSSGKKTLRSYSDPVDLTAFDHLNWMTTDRELWEIPTFLCEVQHHQILTRSQIRNLRDADAIEMRVSDIVEYYDYHVAIARDLKPPFFTASKGADKFSACAPLLPNVRRKKKDAPAARFFQQDAGGSAHFRWPLSPGEWSFQTGPLGPLRAGWQAEGFIAGFSM
jgi:hypothetical protein